MSMIKDAAVERTKTTTSRDLTTGQIATLCGVAPRTVKKWMDAGRIAGCYRIGTRGDGSSGGDRRVPKDAVIAFMREIGLVHRIPQEWQETGAEVQLIDLSADLASDITDTLVGIDAGTKVTSSEGLVAIAEAALLYPSLILADLSFGRSAISAVRQGITKAAAHYRTYLVGVLSQDSDYTVVSAVDYFGLDAAVDYSTLVGARLFLTLSGLLDKAAAVRVACLTKVASKVSTYKRGR